MTDALRQRLPNRRPAITEMIEFTRPSDSVNVSYQATIGFDFDVKPKEIFIFGPKDGTDMQAIVADASVIISVALQHGVPAEAMALSLSRLPAELDGPAVKPASILGAALDALVRHERDVAA